MKKSQTETLMRTIFTHYQKNRPPPNTKEPHKFLRQSEIAREVGISQAYLNQQFRKLREKQPVREATKSNIVALQTYADKISRIRKN